MIFNINIALIFGFIFYILHLIYCMFIENKHKSFNKKDLLR